MTTISQEPQMATSGPASPQEAAAPAKEKKQQEPRTYVILRKDVPAAQSPSQVKPAWVFEANVLATSAEQAVRLHVSTSEIEEGEFVAISSRSFKPVVVKTETKTQLRLT
jgi:hypothetical protein